MRTGDEVLHKPSGEEWVVAYEENNITYSHICDDFELEE